MNFLEAKVKDVQVTEDTLTVDLSDGRRLSVPLAYYPILLYALTDQIRRASRSIGANIAES